MLQQAGSLSSLVHSPHAIGGGVCGGGAGYGYLHDSIGRGFMTPNYMPIRNSFDRTKKGGWVGYVSFLCPSEMFILLITKLKPKLK